MRLRCHVCLAGFSSWGLSVADELRSALPLLLLVLQQDQLLLLPTALHFAPDLQAEQAARRQPCSPAGLLWRTYWRLYHWRIVIHLLWTFTEIACRCGDLLVVCKCCS